MVVHICDCTRNLYIGKSYGMWIISQIRLLFFLSSSGLGGEEVWPKGCRAVALKALLLCRQVPLVLFHFHFISLNPIFLSIRGKSSSFIKSISYLRSYLGSSWHSVSAHPSLLLDTLRTEDSHTESCPRGSTQFGGVLPAMLLFSENAFPTGMGFNSPQP